MNYSVLNREDLPRDHHTYEFVGANYQDIEVSFIWVDMQPGGTIRLHRHPYKEIFIIQEGTAAFTVGTETLQAQAGQIIIVPAGVPHKFRNAGERPLKQVDIHLSRQFITEWLEE